MRPWTRGLALAAIATLLSASTCLAHEEAVIVAGRNGAGQLVVDADFAQPVALAGEPPADADEAGAEHAADDGLAARPLHVAPAIRAAAR